MRFCAGISDGMPQNAAGLPIATVCDPIAAGHMRAATAAADPLLEPPGVCARFHGFLVGPGSRFANIVVTVLPRIIAPAAFTRSTAPASWDGTKSRKTSEPTVVRRPFVKKRSLTPIGTPWSGP